MNLPVFVIGLEQHRQRYEKTMALLEAEGLKASLWPGLDLEKQRLAEGERVCRSCCILLTRGHELKVGEVGCYFSHVRLMQHLLSQEVERALVLECDAQPEEGLLSLLEDIELLDARYELILLCHRHLSAHSFREAPSLQLAGGRSLGFLVGNSYCAAGYVISRNAIEKLLPGILTMKRPLDHAMNSPQLTGVATWAVLPRAIEAEAEPSIIKQGPYSRPWHPESPGSASLDSALYLLLKKAGWLVKLGHFGFRVYLWWRRTLLILLSLGSRSPKSLANAP